jgi:hypothetical protein
MANIFVDSAAAGAGTGADWANAYTTLAAALAVSTNADTIYVANTHNASQTTAKTLTCPTSPGLRILSVTPNGASGNSGLTAGAIEACGAGTVALSINGYAYVYGLSLLGATNSSSSSLVNFGIASTSHGLYFDSCRIESRTPNAAGYIVLGARGTSANDDTELVFINTVFKFGATGQSFQCQGARTRMQSISFDSSGSAPTTLLIGANDSNGTLLIEASDLSGEAWTNLVNAAWTSTYDILLRNCKIPSSISLSTGTHSGPGSVNVRVENCGATDSTAGVISYQFGTVSYAGTVVDESTIVRSGGGATSLRMDSSANTKFPYLPLTVEGCKYNSSVGSALSLTVEFLHSGASALADDKIWVEVQHLGTSNEVVGTIDLDDRAANILTAGTGQATSTATWGCTARANSTAYSLGNAIQAQGAVFFCSTAGTSSGSEPAGYATAADGDTVTDGTAVFRKGRRQKMVCTFTPQEAGYVHFKVCYAPGAAETVYVDLLGVSIA